MVRARLQSKVQLTPAGALWLVAPPLGAKPAQGQLPDPPGEAGDEVLDMLGDCDAFDVAASLDFERDVVRDILCPMLKWSYRQILVTAWPVRRRRFWADGQSVWR